jgi:hypothetical protein
MPETHSGETSSEEVVEASEASTEARGKAKEPTAHALIPVPGTLRTEETRTPFWRRIRLRGSRSGLDEPTASDRVLARLDAVAAQVAGAEQRVEQLDQRFSEVWEVEEQLSRLIELHDILLGVQKRQLQVDEHLRTVERRLVWIAIFAATAAAAGLGTIVSRFL